MQRYIVGLTLAVLCAAAEVGSAQISAENQFFFGQDNLASDNNAEYFIDRNDPQQRGPSVVDPGDVFIGSVGFNSVEDLTGGGGTRTFGGTGGNPAVDELVGIFVVKVATVTTGMNPLTGFTDSLSTLVPVTPADTAAMVGGGQMSAGFKAEIDSWAPGTLVSLYSDPAQDYTRVFNPTYPGPDDGDLLLTGADIGIGPFTAEESLMQSSYNWLAPGGAVRLFELGFTGAAGAPVAGEGWTVLASGSILGPGDDISALRLTPPPINGGLANFGINALANFTSVAFRPVPTAFGGTADVAGSSSILGIGAAQTPFDLFTNTDVVFHPVPEPSTTLLATIALVGLASVLRRVRVRG